MDDNILEHAMKLKSADMMSRRKKFESMPLFIKAGLYYINKYESVRLQSFPQRFCVAELLKQNGNALFKVQQYDKALREYEQALSIFRFIKNNNPNWRQEGLFDENLEYIDYQGSQEVENQQIVQLKLALYLNLSAAYIKLNDKFNSIEATNEAIKLDS